MSSEAKKITSLLEDLKQGEDSSLNQLYELVYPTLKQMARARLRNERAHHTLQPTALVHEAFIKLCQSHGLKLENRRHFYAIAARIMREVLVDHARQKKANKRGGKEAIQVELQDNTPSKDSGHPDLIALNDALESLRKQHPQRAEIVELKYFVGLELDEISELLEISVSTIKREWTAAKFWLYREIKS
jgi:RNA polymerase sigma-70 factor, ECF subfamily